MRRHARQSSLRPVLLVVFGLIINSLLFSFRAWGDQPEFELHSDTPSYSHELIIAATLWVKNTLALWETIQREAQEDWKQAERNIKTFKANAKALQSDPSLARRHGRSAFQELELMRRQQEHLAQAQQQLTVLGTAAEVAKMNRGLLLHRLLGQVDAFRDDVKQNFPLVAERYGERYRQETGARLKLHIPEMTSLEPLQFELVYRELILKTAQDLKLPRAEELLQQFYLAADLSDNITSIFFSRPLPEPFSLDTPEIRQMARQALWQFSQELAAAGVQPFLRLAEEDPLYSGRFHIDRLLAKVPEDDPPQAENTRRFLRYHLEESFPLSGNRAFTLSLADIFLKHTTGSLNRRLQRLIDSLDATFDGQKLELLAPLENVATRLAFLLNKDPFGVKAGLLNGSQPELIMAKAILRHWRNGLSEPPADRQAYVRNILLQSAEDHDADLEALPLLVTILEQLAASTTYARDKSQREELRQGAAHLSQVISCRQTEQKFMAAANQLLYAIQFSPVTAGQPLPPDAVSLLDQLTILLPTAYPGLDIKPMDLTSPRAIALHHLTEILASARNDLASVASSAERESRRQSLEVLIERLAGLGRYYEEEVSQAAAATRQAEEEIQRAAAAQRQLQLEETRQRHKNRLAWGLTLDKAGLLLPLGKELNSEQLRQLLDALPPSTASGLRALFQLREDGIVQRRGEIGRLLRTLLGPALNEARGIRLLEGWGRLTDDATARAIHFCRLLELTAPASGSSTAALENEIADLQKHPQPHSIPAPYGKTANGQENGRTIPAATTPEEAENQLRLAVRQRIEREYLWGAVGKREEKTAFLAVGKHLVLELLKSRERQHELSVWAGNDPNTAYHRLFILALEELQQYLAAMDWRKIVARGHQGMDIYVDLRHDALNTVNNWEDWARKALKIAQERLQNWLAEKKSPWSDLPKPGSEISGAGAASGGPLAAPPNIARWLAQQPTAVSLDTLVVNLRTFLKSSPGALDDPAQRQKWQAVLTALLAQLANHTPTQQRPFVPSAVQAQAWAQNILKQLRAGKNPEELLPRELQPFRNERLQLRALP